MTRSLRNLGMILAVALISGMIFHLTPAHSTPLCPDGVKPPPGHQYDHAKPPKLAASQPMPSCGMSPCTAAELAAPPRKCSTTHYAPKPLKRASAPDRGD